MKYKYVKVSPVEHNNNRWKGIRRMCSCCKMQNNDFSPIYVTEIGKICKLCIERLEETDVDFSIGLGVKNEV